MTQNDPVGLGNETRQSPDRAIEYFRAKAYDISWNWWDTWETAHARTFTVAKAARFTVLETIRSAIDEALVQGKTRREFTRDLKPKLKHLGWWGKQIIVNERGEAQEVQLGSQHRLAIIFDINMRCAHSAACFREQHENAESRPYWLYDARGNECTCPSHAALHGHVFRHDDPLWDTHYPPNGWNCRCSVRALSKSQVESLGLIVREGKGNLKEVEQVVGTNKQTNKIIRRPGTAYEFRGPNGKQQVLLPDPGWSYNPGKIGSTFGPVTGSPERLETIVREANKRTWRTFGLPRQLPRIPEPPMLPPIKQRNEVKAKRQIYDALREACGQRITIVRDDGVQDTIFGRAITPDCLGDVMLTDEFVNHLIDDHLGQKREEFANMILPSLTNPAEVWLKPCLAYNRIVYRRVFITAFEHHNTAFVVQEDRYGNLSWTFYPQSATRGMRRGYLLYRRK